MWMVVFVYLVQVNADYDEGHSNYNVNNIPNTQTMTDERSVPYIYQKVPIDIPSPVPNIVPNYLKVQV